MYQTSTLVLVLKHFKYILESMYMYIYMYTPRYRRFIILCDIHVHGHVVVVTLRLVEIGLLK